MYEQTGQQSLQPPLVVGGTPALTQYQFDQLILGLVGGGNTSVQVPLVAIEDIPAFSVVTSKGKNANSNTISGIENVIGISNAAIATGFSGEVTMIGEIINPDWTWAAGDVLYLNGTSLSTASPSIGFTQRIGTAKNSTTVYVSLGEPIAL